MDAQDATSRGQTTGDGGRLDSELLRRYARDRAEEAFAEVVRRYLSLVYHAALRQVGGDVATAEDVTQQVFTLLARKASSLTRHRTLAGWLHTTTRFAASEARRTERRRRSREQEVHLMHELFATESTADWDRLRPVIDEALGELNERDREAVLLRYFAGLPLAAVGEKLDLSENSARMRVDRALGKLHALLARRGVTSTASAIGFALTTQSSIAAPATLAASVTANALVGASGGTLLAVAFGFMNGTKIMVVVSAVAAGVAAWEYRTARRVEISAGQARQEWQAQLHTQEQRANAAIARADAAEADNARLLTAIAATKASGTVQALEEAAPLTGEALLERLRGLNALMNSGRHEEMFRELVWLLDVGMLKVPDFANSRYQSLAPMFLTLAERGNYPAALEFLRKRRDELEQHVRSGAADNIEAMRDLNSFAEVNRAIKEEPRTLALHDAFPPGDARRRALGPMAVEPLIDAQRYAEAMEFRSYSSMLAQIESQQAAVQQGKAKGFTPPRDKFLDAMGRNIEVLAGAGALTDARTLGERLFAFDSSPEMRAQVQRHLERAGQPTLLVAPPVKQ